MRLTTVEDQSTEYASVGFKYIKADVLVHRMSGADETLTAFDKTVDKNFQDWIFRKQAGALKFTDEQVQWLRMIKDAVAASFHVDKEDFELDPFNKLSTLR